jgi:hypothetical protein
MQKLENVRDLQTLVNAWHDGIGLVEIHQSKEPILVEVGKENRTIKATVDYEESEPRGIPISGIGREGHNLS